MGGFNLQELMSKAKSQYEELQKKMQETVVEASSGGGRWPAKMDGRSQLLSLRIDAEAVKSGDVEMLQDLVLAAVNEAARKIDGAMQSTVGGMLGGLGIGGILMCPFTLVILNKVKDLCIFPLQADCMVLTSFRMAIEVRLD